MKTLISKLYARIPPGVTRALLRSVNASFNVSVAGMFLDRHRKVLVLRHVYRHRMPWGLPGGFLSRGETPVEGALRELKEETGLEAKIRGVVTTHVLSPSHLEIIVAGDIAGEAPLRLNWEIFEGGFFAASELPAAMPENQRACILTYLDKSRPSV